METNGGEFVEVIPATHDDAGNKIEPEERPAREGVKLPIAANLGDHAIRPDATPSVGSMPGMIGVDTTAGEVAQDVATRCELCEHWRQDDWRRHLAIIRETPQGITELNKFRGELLGRSGEISDVHDRMIQVDLTILREFGICAAYTESNHDVTVTPFYGGCGLGDNFFKARDREAKRVASAGYDKILKLAQGRSE